MNILFHSHGAVRWIAKHSLWVAALVLLVSLSASVFVSSKLSSSHTQSLSERIIDRVDLMLSTAVQSNQIVRTWIPSLLSVPCGPVSARLREFVATRVFIRSITVWEQGAYRCSSVFGGISGRVEGPLPRSGHAVQLLASNQLTPDSGVMLIQTATSPTQGVISAISARHLAHVMDMANNARVWLEVGAWRLVLQDGNLAVEPVSAARSCELRRADSHALVTLVMANGCEMSWAAMLLASRVWMVSGPITLLVLMGLLYIRFSRTGIRCRALLDALNHGHLVPHYQPIFTLADGHVCGAEVLMRWHDATLGRVSPEVFVPLLEAMGRTHMLTAHALRRAAHDVCQWECQLPAEFYVSVNISPRELLDSRLVSAVRRFRRTVPHCGLALEITEREPLEASAMLRANVMLLKALGARLLLDDFGTGYAGLSYLTLLRIDCVKIDKSFVQHLGGGDGTSQHILAVIIQLCKSLSMTVIAEGIETLAQRTYLVEQGITFGQGYVIAPALSAAEFGRILTLPK